MRFFKKKQVQTVDVSMNACVCEMQERISEKCHYGENLQNLSEAERFFYITQNVEMEVNNGGFSQYFFNSGGTTADEMVAAFQAIGAEQTASICQKARSAFPRQLPEDMEARRAMMDAAFNDEQEALLSQCDDAFYVYNDDLESLNYAYLQEHQASFAK